MIYLILLLYIVGAVMFWSSHKSESMKRDFLLGLAWPAVVPVNAAMFAVRRVFSTLEERRAQSSKAQAMREAELREREERFIGYGGAGTAKWRADEMVEGESTVEAEQGEKEIL